MTCPEGFAKEKR